VGSKNGKGKKKGNKRGGQKSLFFVGTVASFHSSYKEAPIKIDFASLLIGKSAVWRPQTRKPSKARFNDQNALYQAVPASLHRLARGP
jgi:hypothetical protein